MEFCYKQENSRHPTTPSPSAPLLLRLLSQKGLKRKTDVQPFFALISQKSGGKEDDVQLLAKFVSSIGSAPTLTPLGQTFLVHFWPLI